MQKKIKQINPFGLSEIALFSRDRTYIILFAITADGFVSCGGHKKSPRTSAIVQIIFYFWSLEINGNSLRILKLKLSLEPYSRQCVAFRSFFMLKKFFLIQTVPK